MNPLPAGSATAPTPKRSALRFALNALFWPWNIVLTVLALFGFVPLALFDLVVDAVDGLARWDFVVGSLIMVAVPPATLVYAWSHRKHFHQEPSELAVLFFGVELPLLACTAARLFGFHQLSAAAQFVYFALVAGGVVAESRLIFGKRLPQLQLVDGVAHGLLVLRACAGVYVGFLLATLSLPLALKTLLTWGSAIADVSEGGLFIAALLSPVLAFVGASALLVLTLPISAPVSWVYALGRSGRTLRAAWGLDDLLFASAAPILVSVVSLVVLWPQPHVEAFELLQEPPHNDEQRRALVNQRETIAAGLVDAYLGKHSYVSDDVNDTWAQLWSFNGQLVSSDELGPLNEAMNEAARPFTYAGRLPESKRAAQLYREFFGRELERDYAATVRDALAATWSQEERFAGFINEGQQRVRLASQDVSAQPHDGVIDVEIHDEWVNQTSADEEVALFFELPESAAVTGLWLSPTSNKADGAKFVVAPRGAAQQIYNEEVRAHRDPALLEQVGPRQYRLRVFPVPARAPRDHNVLGAAASAAWAGPDARRVHVWMSYQTLPDVDGRTPMPRLRERRNGFWDQHTVRSQAGTAVEAVDAVDGGGWVQGQPELQVQPQQLRSNVDGVCVTLTPSARPAAALSGRNIDVVIDRSLELDTFRPSLSLALQALQNSGAHLRFVLGSSALRGEEASVVDHVNVDDLVFYGAARPKDLLRQLLQLRTSDMGDAVVVLTGSASFDVADDTKLDLQRLPNQKLPPTVLVHLTGAMPSGYDDVTLDALRRSGGNATTDIGSGLALLSGSHMVDGYGVDVGGQCAAGGAFAVAARQQILAADRGGLAPVEALDRLHRIAVDAGVVTPYSSMIVLLNDQQRARLQQLNQQHDRFDREVDADTKANLKTKADEPRAGQNVENTPQKDQKVAPSLQAPPSPPSVSAVPAQDAPQSEATTNNVDVAAAEAVPPAPPATTTAVAGVPEPAEWLLLLLAVALVVTFELRRRRA